MSAGPKRFQVDIGIALGGLQSIVNCHLLYSYRLYRRHTRYSHNWWLPTHNKNWWIAIGLGPAGNHTAWPRSGCKKNTANCHATRRKLNHAVSLSCHHHKVDLKPCTERQNTRSSQTFTFNLYRNFLWAEYCTKYKGSLMWNSLPLPPMFCSSISVFKTYVKIICGQLEIWYFDVITKIFV